MMDRVESTPGRPQRRLSWITAGQLALLLALAPAAPAQDAGGKGDAPKPDKPAADKGDQKAEADPKIQGRKLSVWRAELQHDEPGRRRLAIAAIGTAGTTARSAAADVAARLGSEPEATLRVELLKTLRELKPAAPMVLEELKGALTDKHRTVRAETIEALIDLGAAARPARADLMARLVLEDLQLCERIGRALSNFKDKALGAAIAGLLKDPRPPIRARAAVAAGCLGSTAAPALPALLDGLSDPNSEVAQTMNDALARLTLAPGDLPRIAALLKQEKDREAGEARRTRISTLAYVASRIRPGGAVMLVENLPMSGSKIPYRDELRAGILRALRYSTEREALPAIFDKLQDIKRMNGLDDDAELRETLIAMDPTVTAILIWRMGPRSLADESFAKVKKSGLNHETLIIAGPAIVETFADSRAAEAKALLMESKAAVHAWLTGPDAPQGKAYDELRAAVKPKEASKDKGDKGTDKNDKKAKKDKNDDEGDDDPSGAGE